METSKSREQSFELKREFEKKEKRGGGNKIAPVETDKPEYYEGPSDEKEKPEYHREPTVDDATQTKDAEVVKRDNWGGKLDFFLSALSFSVGLGAVWRFPYLCYKNGGGAFLIPFLLFLLLLGIPLMYMELSLGQFTALGPIKSWVMVSLSRGIGISTTIINNYLSVYYIMIIGYSLYYLILSLRIKLPWQDCEYDKWASANCVDNFDDFTFTYCTDKDDPFKYLKCTDDGKCFLNTTTSTLDEVSCEKTNHSLLTFVGYWDPIYPSQDYWNNVVLQKSSGIDESGGLVWQLVVALFAAWIITFLCVFRGVKVSGKIVYFTALFPYVVLLILGIRGLFLPGAGIGIEYYIKPDPEKLLDLNVWKDAAVQVFFSLSLSYGGLIALSSYNRFDHNCLRDALFLSISNFLTCILAGFVVFIYMGALANATNIAIENVVQGGQGLVYIVYPYAATTIEGGPIWAIMFFIMMLALGMGTIMAAIQTLITTLEDFFPFLKKTARIKAITLAVVCTIFFLIGLLFCSRAGSYWIEIFDNYSANWGIFLVAIFQCVCVAWLYGIKRYETDVTAMIPDDSLRLLKFTRYAFVWWRVTWQFVTPILLFALFIFSWIDVKPLKLGDYEFPTWTLIFGNIITFTTLLGILGWVCYELYLVLKKKKTFRDIITTTPMWRPALQENYQRWLEIKRNANQFYVNQFDNTNQYQYDNTA